MFLFVFLFLCSINQKYIKWSEFSQMFDIFLWSLRRFSTDLHRCSRFLFIFRCSHIPNIFYYLKQPLPISEFFVIFDYKEIFRRDCHHDHRTEKLATKKLFSAIFAGWINELWIFIPQTVLAPVWFLLTMWGINMDSQGCRYSEVAWGRLD